MGPGSFTIASPQSANTGRSAMSQVTLYSRPYIFTVVFKDSTKISKLSKIDEHNGQFFLAIDQPGEMRAIQPSETLELSRYSEQDGIYKGMATDSCWLFKVEEGKINLYSVLPENESRFVVALQRGDDGPILPLTIANVKEAIKDDEELLEKLNEKKLVGALMKYNKRAGDE
jgi:hypothetical protein